ncbi:MAG: diphthamide biosynthesis enzyme Dph2 [Thermoprotei archaeon]|nr:MAG: diphthamide biosynthesis enzyme Dph2 [Thermoprotei archaeon]
MDQPYDLEVDRVLSWLRKEKASKVLVQAPDGIKPYLGPLVSSLENEGVEVYISGGHAWGGCDIAINEARILGITHIVHIGHHGPVRVSLSGVKALFIPGKANVDVSSVVRKGARLLKRKGDRRVALLTTAQHVHKLDEAARILEKEGLQVLIGKSPDPSMPKGLVVGCDLRALDSLRGFDSVMVIAGGLFHGVGAALWTGRRVILADPYTGSVKEGDDLVRKTLATRLRDISQALDASEILMVVSSKPGQLLLEGARRIRDCLRRRGKRAYIAVFNEVTREALENMGRYDAYINTACPRLAIDDREIFPGPVINLGEVSYLLGRELSTYDPRDALRTFLSSWEISKDQSHHSSS